MDFLSCVFPFLCCRSPRKVFRRWHAPRTSGQFVPKLTHCGVSPAGVFLFGRSFYFQGAVPNVRKSGLSEKNTNLGLLRKLHFLKAYTYEIAFLQVSCIMETYGGGAYLWHYPELPDSGFQTFATGGISHKRNGKENRDFFLPVEPDC